MKGETEGIALLTQYNGHGIFIALEELGYITMSIALFFLAPVFSSTNRLNKSIRWILFLPLILNIISFVLYSIKFGINRHYRFEVASISIDWLLLIVVSILISIYFKRQLKNNDKNQTGFNQHTL
jgi:putative effector of murein hydrolase